MIVRFTRYDTENPQDWVSLKAAFSDPHRADAEARRLNALVENKPQVQYFVKIVKFSNEDESLAG